MFRFRIKELKLVEEEWIKFSGMVFEIKLYVFNESYIIEDVFLNVLNFINRLLMFY